MNLLLTIIFGVGFLLFLRAAVRAYGWIWVSSTLIQIFMWFLLGVLVFAKLLP